MLSVGYGTYFQCKQTETNELNWQKQNEYYNHNEDKKEGKEEGRTNPNNL